jgi:hypothetical protein
MISSSEDSDSGLDTGRSGIPDDSVHLGAPALHVVRSLAHRKKSLNISKTNRRVPPGTPRPRHHIWCWIGILTQCAPGL